MSNLSSQVTARRLKRGGTEVIRMSADAGGMITQDIIGVHEDGSVIVAPDFAVPANQPTILPVITVSTQIGQVVPTDPVWYYNGATISFNSDGISTGAFAGLFQKTTRQSDQMPGLKIIQNLATQENRVNAAIGFNGEISAGGFKRRISSTYTVQIRELSGDVRVGTISYPDGKNGVINTHTETVQLKANLRQGNYVMPENEYNVQWKKLDGENWIPLLNDSGVVVTGKTITVSEGMVNSFQLIMAEFTEVNGDPITTAVTEVTDASDPLLILTVSNPSDGYFGSDGKVVFTPSVSSRQNPGNRLSGWTFSYNVIKQDGTSLRTATGASVTITLQDSDATGGGNVDVIITAIKS